MGRVLNQERANEHKLSEKEFKFICKLVYDVTGIVLNDGKREMVYRRLMRRTRELRIASFSDYCRLLSEKGSDELPNFINAITTNLTSFFRENHHFEYLRHTFLPDHIQRFSASRRLRIWSAACSTGEEPYSLAMTLQQVMGSQITGGELNHWDAKILATDLDTDVLNTGRQGIYKEDRIKDIPPALRKQWFKRGAGDFEGYVKVHPSLQQLIAFKQLNLLHEWPVKGPFDVIMCRNVLIYFDRSTQKGLVERYAELLRPGGLLILGHSESIAKGLSYFELKGRTIFEKRASNLH